MGLKFRKRIKIAPGVKLNITAKGVSSVSIGGKGLTANIGKKGTKVTTSLPGTGLSYTHKLTQVQTENLPQTETVLAVAKAEASNNLEQVDKNKGVGFWLGTGILFMPYIFSWVLLQEGYSAKARYISFGWLAWCAFILIK